MMGTLDRDNARDTRAGRWYPPRDWKRAPYAIGKRMAEAQGDITTIQGDITTIQGDITTIQTQITGLSPVDTSITGPTTGYYDNGTGKFQVTVFDFVAEDNSPMVVLLTVGEQSDGLRYPISGGSYPVTFEHSGYEEIYSVLDWSVFSQCHPGWTPYGVSLFEQQAYPNSDEWNATYKIQGPDGFDLGICDPTNGKFTVAFKRYTTTSLAEYTVYARLTPMSHGATSPTVVTVTMPTFSHP